MKWTIGIILVAVFWTFTCFNLGVPSSLNFDEFHYVPAAKVFLGNGPVINLEHPPLGKMLISLGMALFGDAPIGWRFMSMLFGALTLGGIYFWSLILFSSVPVATFVSVLTIANNLLFVQSRIAMLDTFMVAFLIWGAAFFSWWLKDKKTSLLVVSGALLGLSTATKWFTLLPFGLCFMVVLYSERNDIPRSLLLSLFFGVAFFLAYALSFSAMPFHHGQSWAQFFSWQTNIWSAQQRVIGNHPYESSWWSWPLQLRPIWYSYAPTGARDTVHGVFFIGNPLVLWAGLLAVFHNGWLALKARCPVAKTVVLSYAICLVGYALVPRKLMFFYYYYPGAMVLGLALARSLEEWDKKLRWGFALLAVALFAYYYPILSGRPFHPGELGKWAWFRSWI